MDLLREENYKREGKGSQYFEPLFIQYISVRKALLDIIELVKFGEGNTTVTLNFVRPWLVVPWFRFILAELVVIDRWQ